MTSQELLIIAGAVLAFLFAYVPKLADWFKSKDETVQRLIMLGVLALSTAAVFGLSCLGAITKVTCDKPGAIGLLVAFFYAIISNQGVYSILPKVGANTPVSKNVVVTSAQGVTETVGVKETGVVTDVPPVVPPEQPPVM